MHKQLYFRFVLKRKSLQVYNIDGSFAYVDQIDSNSNVYIIYYLKVDERGEIARMP